MVLGSHKRKVDMNKLNKALVGTAAAAAMAVSATPAMARDGRDNGISAGEVIAGAVVLGGLAAILTSGKNDRYNGYDDRYDYRGQRYDNNARYSRLNSRTAVDRCVRAAERQASRNYGTANVTQIRDVDRTRYGYRVKGKIAVQETAYRGNRGRNYRANYDTGKFTCYLDGRGRPQVDFNNLNGGRRY